MTNPDYLPVFRKMSSAYGALALFGLHPPQVTPLFAPVLGSDLLHGVVLVQGIDRTTEPAQPILFTINCGPIPNTDVNVNDEGEEEAKAFAVYAQQAVSEEREMHTRDDLVMLGEALVKMSLVDRMTMESAVASFQVSVPPTGRN